MRGPFRGPFRRAMSNRYQLLKRYIRTGNGSSAYGELLTPEVLEIGDKAGISFCYPVGGTSSFIFGGAVEFDAGDLIQLTDCTAMIDGTPIADGADMSAYIDGKEGRLIITATAQLTITHLWQSGSSTGFFGGELYDFYTTISGVTVNWPIDKDSTVFEQPRGYGLGINSITGNNSTFDTGVGDWVPAASTLSAVDGSLRVTPTGTNGQARLSIPVEIGNVYRVSVDLVDVNGSVADHHIFCGTSLGGQDYASRNLGVSTGTYDVVFKATTTTLYVSLYSGESTLYHEWDNVKLEEAPKALAYYNFAEADINPYTLNRRDDRWEGVNLITDSTFDTACGVNWTCGSGWSSGSGEASCDGTNGTTVAELSKTDGVSRFLTSYSNTSVTSGGTRIVLGGTGGTVNSPEGLFTEVLSATVNGHVEIQSFSFNGSIDNATVKRVLERS